MPSVRLSTNCAIWYQARGSLEQAGDNELGVCYAVSCDGIQCEKSELELVDTVAKKTTLWTCAAAVVSSGALRSYTTPTTER